MIDYFLPISLLVLGGFALGLLVGRLAWGSPDLRRTVDEPSKPRDRASARARPISPTVSATTASTSPQTKPSDPGLPVWQGTEIGR